MEFRSLTVDLFVALKACLESSNSQRMCQMEREIERTKAVEKSPGWTEDPRRGAEGWLFECHVGLLCFLGYIP